MKRILYVIAATALFVGCGDDSSESIDNDSTDTSGFSLTATIPSSGIVAKWDADSEFGVYSNYTSGDKEAIIENVKFLNDQSATSSTLSFNDTITEEDIPEYTFMNLGKDSSFSIVAYTPYDKDLDGDYFRIYVDVADQDDELAMNLMVASLDSTVGGKSITLNFKHTMAMLAINVTQGEGVTASELSAMDVVIEGLSISAVYELDEMSFTDYASTGDITMNSSDGGAKIKALLLPTTEGLSDVKVQFAVTTSDSVEYSLSDLIGSSVQNLSANTLYTANVTLTREKRVTIDGSANITDWIDAD